MSNTTKTNGRDQGELWKGLVAGLIGGLVASWAMNRFQDVWIKLSESAQPEEQGAENQSTNDDTTVKAASAISEGLLITN